MSAEGSSMGLVWRARIRCRNRLVRLLEETALWLRGMSREHWYYQAVAREPLEDDDE